MITDFLKTQRPKAELKIALDVIRDFKNGENLSEWAEIPFMAWSKLEQLEEYLAHMVEGAALEKATLEYIERSKSNGI